jgi:hypothetical protein
MAEVVMCKCQKKAVLSNRKVTRGGRQGGGRRRESKETGREGWVSTWTKTIVETRLFVDERGLMNEGSSARAVGGFKDP